MYIYVNCGWENLGFYKIIKNELNCFMIIWVIVNVRLIWKMKLGCIRIWIGEENVFYWFKVGLISFKWLLWLFVYLIGEKLFLDGFFDYWLWVD